MDTVENFQSDFDNQADIPTFKDEWIGHLQDNFPIYNRLPKAIKEALHVKITQFISSTSFEGHNGLTLCDEMIVTVAAQACLLVLNHAEEPYPELHTVLLYPTVFSSTIEHVDAEGTVSEQTVECEGESWEDGTVLLAWDAVSHGARNLSDGDNVTFHEFAHQLDARDGDTDGVPLLANEEAYQTWASVLGEHCGDFIDRVMQGLDTVLDPYAATNPGEFFAVATETFFEKPHQLKAKRPSLYAELQAFYQLDPSNWSPESI